MASLPLIGWDIGGAHLKAAYIEAPNRILAIYQISCELWRGLDCLEQAMQAILAALNNPDCRHAITMTGELVDLFADRNEGVARILETMAKQLPDREISVYAGRAGLMPFGQISPAHYCDIASANWLASATWAARQIAGGLLVDVGSTTTDILLLQGGRVLAQGYSDYDRLASREMVYTGVVRTPVMAVAQAVADQGRSVGVMAEYFATMADVYRLTGDLDENYDQAATADGGAKSVAASAKRLARMVGCDYNEVELPRWIALANHLKTRQMMLIKSACEGRLAGCGNRVGLTVMGAGIGRFLVKRIADELSIPYADYSDLFRGGNSGGFLPSDCAPAAAVACLAFSAG